MLSSLIAFIATDALPETTELAAFMGVLALGGALVWPLWGPLAQVSKLASELFGQWKGRGSFDRGRTDLLGRKVGLWSAVEERRSLVATSMNYSLWEGGTWLWLGHWVVGLELGCSAHAMLLSTIISNHGGRTLQA